MKSMGILAIGAAIGYAMNTEGGRAKINQLKDSAGRRLGSPEVQARTADFADRARQKVTLLPDPVQRVANSTIDAAEKATGSAANDS